MKKYLTKIIALAGLACVPSTQAEFKYSFADIGMHYLDWTDRTTHRTGNRSHKDDFAYLELEGGMGFSWGEIYGFFDWENPFNARHEKVGSEQRYTFKNTNRIYLGDSGFNFYTHIYGTYGSPARKNFHDVMFLYGLGYNLKFNGFWFKPFITSRYTDQTYFRGSNGYIFGWGAGYDFTLGGEYFTLTNWNEYEFERRGKYAQGNGGTDGVNGAVALWWKPVPSITTGIQYRYADNKLGDSFLVDGIIYSLKYNF